VALEGEPARAFLIRVKTPGSRWETWVTADGEVLLQGTPVGVTLRRSGVPESVFTALQEAAAEEDQS
jgi:hypothetical protein